MSRSSDPALRYPVEAIRTSAFYGGVAASRRLELHLRPELEMRLVDRALDAMGRRARAGTGGTAGQPAQAVAAWRRSSAIRDAGSRSTTISCSPSPAIPMSGCCRPISTRFTVIATRRSGAGSPRSMAWATARSNSSTSCGSSPPRPTTRWTRIGGRRAATLCPTVVPYNFIGSLENFDADLAHILSRIFPDRAVPIRDHKPHRTGARPRSSHEYYGPEELRLVQAIYERDFAELGYDLDLASPSRRTPTPRPDSAHHQGLGPGLPADGRARFRRRGA